LYDPTTGFDSTRTLGNNTYTYIYGSDVASQLGCPSSISRPVGAPVEMKYNANLQVIETKRGSLIEDFGYDELGHRAHRKVQFGDGKTLLADASYDVKGFLWTNILSGVEIQGQPGSLEYTYTPDALSRVASIHHPEGTTEMFSYDSRGNLTNATMGDYVEEHTVDLNNNVVAVKEGGQLVKTIAYDGLDRPITTTRKTGVLDQVESATYYNEGEVKSRALGDSQFGVVHEETIDQIDALGRSLHISVSGTTVNPEFTYSYGPGTETTTGPRMAMTQTWDAAGYTTGMTDPILTATSHPDGNGRVDQVDRQEDGATYNDYYTYDDMDNRTSTADNFGPQFLYGSRADGGLLGATNANGHFTLYDRSVLGEILDVRRQDGMEFQYRHDSERQPAYNGDPAGGHTSAYDLELRMTNSSIRNGASTLFGNFDPQNMPQTSALPGNGVAQMQYDLQKRLTEKSVAYQSTTYQYSQNFDALDRARVVSYQQDGGGANSSAYSYDEAGPLLTAEFNEDGGNFTVKYGYYSDLTRQSIAYPSGVTVTEQRDTTGRLTGVSDGNGNIISATSWQGNKEPKVVQLGATIQIVNTYDSRGRVTGSRATRLSDGSVLTHLRYKYDAADNQLIRQFVHREGKADGFSYDAGERVSQAQIGEIPLSAGSFTLPLSSKTYNYHLGGFDYLTSTTFSNLSASAPPFATNWTAHDDFLRPTVIDGFTNGPADPMGNVAQTLLQTRPNGGSGTVPISARLTNNGNGFLTHVVRADGVTEDNYFQPNGLRYERKVSQNGLTLDFRHFVYDDDGRLLEEYQQMSGSPQLIGRYYYGDSDPPVAADLADSGGVLHRYYYLMDEMGSVVAVADSSGAVVERVWYDPFGQPAIEQRDTQAPKVQSVTETADGGSILIALSESVSAPTNDPGPGGGIIFWPPVSSVAVSVSVNSTNLAGSAQLLPSLPGYPPYSVLKMTLQNALPSGSNSIAVSLKAGSLADEWGNTNNSATVTFSGTNLPGQVLYNGGPSSTAAQPLARSSVGSPFLFHGQYFDYDTGLIYLRSRFYDPYSGMFMEPDPLGYADSVNLYAAMANNPVGSRDPSGLVNILEEIKSAFGALRRSGSTVAREGAQESRAVSHMAEDLERAPRPTLTSQPMRGLTGGGAIAEAEKARFGWKSRNALEMEADKAAANAAREEAEAAARAEQEAQAAAARAEAARIAAENQQRAAEAARNARFRPFIAEQENRVVGFMTSRGIDESVVRSRMSRRMILDGADLATATDSAKQTVYQAVATPVEANAFDLFIHGSPYHAFWGDRLLNVKEVADLIKSHPGYRQGMKVRLLSCETGLEENGFAKWLSDELNASVSAPTGLLWANGTSGFRIGTDLYGTAGTFRHITRP
jgi:RHS repeat-associated protein